MKIITVEEHFMSEKVEEQYCRLVRPSDSVEENQAAFIRQSIQKGEITNLGEERIAFMDANGIAAQIIGYGHHSPSRLRKEDGAAALCALANDELYAATRQYPGRFYGYATLPMDDVEAAVGELERCVGKLGFRGVLCSSLLDGTFLDGERFFPIFQKAAELDVPVYLHPAEPAPEVRRRYYEGSWNERMANVFAGFGIGWHYDTAVHLLRLILSGLFDRLPELKIIVGHWGELLPFYFDRLNATMRPQATGLLYGTAHYFRHNIYTNPSGMYFRDDMEFCLKVFPPEHILWAQDYPYGINDEKVKTFLEGMKLENGLREDIACRNAERLFKFSLQPFAYEAEKEYRCI